MDEQQGAPLKKGTLAEKSTRALESLRDRARILRADEAERWGNIESRITENLQTIAEELAREREACATDRTTTENQSANLADREAEFLKLQDDVRDEQRELAEYLQNQQDRLNLHEQELIQRSKLLNETEQLLEDTRQQLDTDRKALERTQQRLAEKEASLERQRDELASDRGHLKEQRRRVAGQLAEQRKKIRGDGDQEQNAQSQRREKELERRAAEVDRQIAALDSRDADQAEEIGRLNGELSNRDGQIADMQSATLANENELDRLREINARLEIDLEAINSEADSKNGEIEQLTAVQARYDELLAEQKSLLSQQENAASKEVESVTVTRDRLADALAETEDKLAQATDHLASQPDTSELERKFELAMEEARDLRATNAKLVEELASRPDAEPNDSQELIDLREERVALVARITEMEREAAVDVDPSTREQFEDLQRRFELAVEDVRELKNENAELEQKLDNAQQDTQNKDSDADEGLDWEAMKRRLFESMDEEFDDHAEEDREQRTTIEGTIQITDDMIAKKDEEIVELTQLLEEQSGNIGEVAVGAGAVAELFDQDEIIVQERERLTELQAEWQEKLRQAELEFSVQRAKFAREKVGLEQNQRDMEDARADLEEALRATPEETGPKKRKWLTRLGLNKEDG